MRSASGARPAGPDAPRTADPVRGWRSIAEGPEPVKRPEARHSSSATKPVPLTAGCSPFVLTEHGSGRSARVSRHSCSPCAVSADCRRCRSPSRSSPALDRDHAARWSDACEPAAFRSSPFLPCARPRVWQEEEAGDRHIRPPQPADRRRARRPETRSGRSRPAPRSADVMSMNRRSPAGAPRHGTSSRDRGRSQAPAGALRSTPTSTACKSGTTDLTSRDEQDPGRAMVAELIDRPALTADRERRFDLRCPSRRPASGTRGFDQPGMCLVKESVESPRRSIGAVSPASRSRASATRRTVAIVREPDLAMLDPRDRRRRGRRPSHPGRSGATASGGAALETHDRVGRRSTHAGCRHARLRTLRHAGWTPSTIRPERVVRCEATRAEIWPWTPCSTC